MGHHRERMRQKRRLLRQFAVLEKRLPFLRGPIHYILQDGWILLRVPLALLMILGGVFSFLSFLAAWMLPLGFLLLAADIPAMCPVTSALAIQGRRWANERIRRLRSRSASSSRQAAPGAAGPPCGPHCGRKTFSLGCRSRTQRRRTR